MTEAEWAACREPDKMLAFLRDTGRLSERKARLFAVACCRRIWPLLTDERSRKAVEVAERQADGLATHEELVAACQAAASAWGAAAYAADAAASVSGEDASITALLAADAAAYATEEQTEVQRHAEEAQQSELLRDLVGNPPRRLPVLDPFLRTPDIVALAKHIYDERSFDRTGELADALSAAGCTDAELLAHVSSPGPHVRGCHGLDLLLNKE